MIGILDILVNNKVSKATSTPWAGQSIICTTSDTSFCSTHIARNTSNAYGNHHNLP